MQPCSASLDRTKQLDHATAEHILVNPRPVRDDFRIAPITALETNFRHSGWHARRRQTFESLLRTGATPTRLERFCNCGSACCVQVNDATGQVRLCGNYCHDRLCVPCGRARSAKVTRALIKESEGRAVRFATFTLKHSKTRLTDQIDRIYRSFGTLRRRSWFKARCTGGAAVLEIKLGKEGLWHVHLHTLLIGSWMDQATLSAEWHAVTGDSYIVDIRKVDHGKDAIRYCASYVGKPVDSSIYESPDRLDEAAVSLKGRRVVNTWGDWSKLDLDAQDEADGNWFVVGRLSDLIRSAAEGDRAAAVMFWCLTQREDPPLEGPAP